jgi:CRP-like cAMP-binding protein
MLNQPNRLLTVRNCILRSLSFSDFSHIRPLLQPVVLNERSVLQESNKRIEYVSFIESGIISLRTLAIGCTLETAFVGYHGAVGVSVALGGETSIHRSIVLARGSALRIRADDLQRAMLEQPQIREHLLRYVQALMIHNTQTTLCGVRHELEQRLACWLCLVSDALDDDVIPITHDLISDILGLRRTGITETLGRFEKQGLVRKTRRVVQVRDRGQLRRRACCCYRVIANAYDWTKSRALAPNA